MGCKYQVESWETIDDWGSGKTRKFVSKYYGDWLIVAIIVIVKEKLCGIDCIQLSIRR